MSEGIGGSSAGPAARAPQSPPRRSVLLPTLVTLGVLLLLMAVFTGVWTDRLWFSSVQIADTTENYSSVFSTVLFTRTTLFIVGALILAGSAALNAVLAYRSRPFARVAAAPRNESLERWRASIDPVRGRVLAVLTLVLAVLAGSVAAGQWQSFMLWLNGGEWGQNDVYFTGTDIGFFVFDYPWLRFVTSFLFVTLAVSIIAAGVTHYLYGGIDLQARRGRLTGAAQTHLSILIGLFVLLKAWAYWLDRFAFAMSDGGLFTGVQYTDANARIPAKEILVIIAVICSLLLFANAVRRNWLLPGLGLGLLLLSSILLSGVWPAIMQQFQVEPSEPDREGPFIGLNIEATRDGYDVSGVEETRYEASTEVTARALKQQGESLPNTRLLDPTLVSPAFTQLQQVRGFYSVPETLDVDRYRFGDNEYPQDVVVAAREVNLEGLDDTQRNWANDHTVYTHGFGVIGAYGDRRGAEGQPEWAESQIPPRGAISELSVAQSEDDEPYQPRIYFGEDTPEYSIVGGTESPVEVDYPTSTDSSSEPTLNTYESDGGVEVGGLINKVLYALKFGEPNIVLSSRVHEDSQILYDRDPRQRVEKVAPWLTVDGNAYPAVVGGQMLWIVDAYTTANTYPMSDRVDLDSATADTNTEEGSTTALPSDQITYLRNSVKATVDAYTGEVALYEWDEDDPILDAWRETFPDTVQSKDEISEPLLEHLRYPEDLFKVQREVLQTYHVEEASTFYSGTERWEVPTDPAASSESVLQPPYYLSVQMPEVDEEGAVTGARDPAFSLTSVYTPRGRQNLSAFVAVNSDPTSDDYGTIGLLVPPAEQISGPRQIATQFQSDEGVADALLSYRQADVSVLYGNLLTVPVSNGLLYVQPIYTQRSSTSGTGTYPQLQFVLASFGENVGIAKTLEDALADALGTAPPADTAPDDGGDGGDGGPAGGGGGGGGQPGNADVAELLARASEIYERAQAELSAGELGNYQDLIEQYNSLIERAQQQLEEPADTEPPAPDETEPPAPDEAEPSPESNAAAETEPTSTS
ncbi:MAG TPA: UPF0182 family protein [Nocardioidaceae bacterium]|nr:UPF0182 family protein [Nocardioidaceae bacterium]